MKIPEHISRAETLRCLGNSSVAMNDEMQSLLDSCEEKLLRSLRPKWLYKRLNPSECGLLEGESIREHLSGCGDAVLMCVTLGTETDRLIRSAQVEDMASAVVLDAMASVATEQLCDELEAEIAAKFPEKSLTWRFSPGYGDYPISLQKTFLSLLDAPRRIGLCTNDSSILTPMKSVTAIIGLSDAPVERKRRGCAGCNLNKTCKFRKAGTRCDF